MADSKQRSSYNCNKEQLNMLGILMMRLCCSHGDSHSYAETCHLLIAPLLQMTMADSVRPIDGTITWDRINYIDPWPFSGIQHLLPLNSAPANSPFRHTEMNSDNPVRNKKKTN